jgi:hypothetical protein
MIRLKTSDNKIFSLQKENAINIGFIKQIIDEDDDNIIPLLKVDSETFEYIVKFLEYRKIDNSNIQLERPLKNDFSELVDKWYVNFFQQMNDDIILKLLNACNFLDLKELLDLGCAFLADSIKKRNIEDIKKLFQD